MTKHIDTSADFNRRDFSRRDFFGAAAGLTLALTIAPIPLSCWARALGAKPWTRGSTAACARSHAVDQNHQGTGEDREGLDEWVVALFDGLEKKRSETRYLEDLF